MEDGVECEQALAVEARGEVGGRFGPGVAVAACAQFVKQFAAGVAIRRGRAEAIERRVTFGPHQRARVIDASDEADVRQLRHAANEDDVGRFHVTVHEFVRVQMRERAGEGVADFQNAVDGQRAVLLEFGAERSRGRSIQ